jgi:DNA adenine methylase
MEVMKPLLKWAGGKRHILPVLVKYLPSGWNDGVYFEPFVGGAALFLHLAPDNAQIADVNPWLVGFYRDVQKRPQELFGHIQNYAMEFDSLDHESQKDFYLKLRAQFNAHEQIVDTSALFYVLNKLCFNGLYRENSKGQFNVPFGQKKNFPKPDEEAFLEASRALNNSKIELADFEETVSRAAPGDFIYFDPPYVPITATSNFTSYSSGGFGLDSQKRLAETMHELRERGVKAMLSNSSSELTAEIYEGLRQETISAPRMVSAKASGRGQIDELLVMNY